MTEQDDTATAKLARGMVAGVIAGAVAAFVMYRFQAVVSPLLPSSGNGDEKPATEKTADAVATALTGHRSRVPAVRDRGVRHRFRHRHCHASR